MWWGGEGRGVPSGLVDEAAFGEGCEYGLLGDIVGSR